LCQFKQKSDIFTEFFRAMDAFMPDTLQIELSIARNANSYDLLPYESKSIPQSHPARLAAIAKIFGLIVNPVHTARVLELGCASGGNLIPMALNYPEAKFVGVDVSPKQIEAGLARIEKIGLKNLELHCKSFSDLSAEAGQFDYILCHGVFSWVPRALQDSIFDPKVLPTLATTSCRVGACSNLCVMLSPPLCQTA
jgi:2-polyprenyl-3-methyl-5-hydroxy-6-metoxy-1,4-benzoquinol methylase